MKRTILFILMVFCLPIIFAGSINAQEQKTIDINKRQIAYLESTFQEKMSDHNAKISNVKKAFDFDGNEYIIIEGDSNGYMIYSVNSAIIVEYSSQSKSPCLEYKRDLFYGGPTFYYVLENDKLKHTIINENFSKNEISSFKQSSVELNQALYEQRDKQVLAYINEGVVKKNSIGVQSNSANTIKNPEFFENLDDFGYMSGGVCGFIGLNMLIAYHDAH